MLETATIKTHVQRTLARRGTRNRVELVIAAYEWGFVTPGRPGVAGDGPPAST